jgi:hypothetical protein
MHSVEVVYTIDAAPAAMGARSGCVVPGNTSRYNGYFQSSTLFICPSNQIAPASGSKAPISWLRVVTNSTDQHVGAIDAVETHKVQHHTGAVPYHNTHQRLLVVEFEFFCHIRLMWRGCKSL